MLLDRHVGLFLQREPFRLPTRKLLVSWMAAGMEPGRCAAALARIIEEDRLDPSWFDLGAFERGGLVATPRLLYDSCAEAPWLLGLAGAPPLGWRRSVRPFPVARLPEAASFVRSLASLDDPAALQRAAADLLGSEAPALAGPPRPHWPLPEQPGLYRREHASILVRSRQTSILLDPLALAVGAFPPALADAPLDAAGEHIDAVLISHAHADHFHLPSILHHVRPETPVVVPQVPRVNLLTPESPAESLAAVGQHVLTPAWGDSLQIGDIELEVLPFYGEQPCRDAPGPAPDLRNWGNCYAVRTPDFSALFLVDSGTDPAGNMVDCVRDLAQRRGPVDVVLSCMQQFASPFSVGVSWDFLTLPFDRLRELYRQLVQQRLPSATAGLVGAAQACVASAARHYLTYANGFSGVGVVNGLDWGADEPEAVALRQLGELVRARGGATQVLDWNPGDVAIMQNARLSVSHIAI